MKKTAFYRHIAATLLSFVALFGLSVNVSAEHEYIQYQYEEEGAHLVYRGGLNKFDGVKATNREETEEMELELYANDYVLVSTDNKQIDEEEYNLLRRGAFWFIEYLNNERATWNTNKVFIYRPTLEDYFEQMRENAAIKTYVKVEMNNSTVVLKYSVWDSKEAAGTITYAFNENLAEGSGGYLEIRSNVSCEVTLLQASTRQYYVFYVEKDVPFIVRIICDCYHVTMVNDKSIPDNINGGAEDTLPYNNTIQILPHNTLENPYLLEFQKLNAKYGILDIDIDGKPNYNILSETKMYSIDVDEKRAILDKYEQLAIENEDTKPDKPFEIPFILILLIVLVLLLVLWLLSQRKGKSNKDNDKE